MQTTLNLNKKQFERLMKVVYLGNWLINANRDHPIKEYEAIEDLIFSLAGKFGLEKYVVHEPGDGSRYYPSRIFEEETDVDDFHEEYDEQTFWDELGDRLVHRDFVRKYGIKAIQNMTREERWTKLAEFEEYWANEINNHGIERLEIMRDNIFVLDEN